eukprot:m.294870 g.294870  ORF g.294870 m.294870 type:complete len:369 (-) comp13072_c0_seq1:372-1478(-)
MSSLIRKASASFKGSVTGHKELQHQISVEKNAKSAHKQWIRAQSEASQYLLKWAAVEDNPAFQDVAAQLLELNQCWTEVQTFFLQDLKNHRKAFELILAQEKAGDVFARNKVKCEKAEKGAERDINKLSRRGDNTAAAETKLRQARSLREMAQSEAQTSYTDGEQFKARTFKESMEQLTDGYIAMMQKGLEVFKAQKELIRLMPDTAPHIDGTILTTMPALTAQTSQIVSRTRDRVRAEAPTQSRRLSYASARGLSRRTSTTSSTSSSITAPPAYALTDPAMLSSDSDDELQSSRFRSRRLNSTASLGSTPTAPPRPPEELLHPSNATNRSDHDPPVYSVPYESSRPECRGNGNDDDDDDFDNDNGAL